MGKIIRKVLDGSSKRKSYQGKAPNRKSDNKRHYRALQERIMEALEPYLPAPFLFQWIFRIFIIFKFSSPWLRVVSMILVHPVWRHELLLNILCTGIRNRPGERLPAGLAWWFVSMPAVEALDL